MSPDGRFNFRYDRAIKAAVIFENGSPDVLRYEDVPDPVCPDGCVLLDVEAISIEGGDLLARATSPPPETPHIVGYLCAGTVVEVGAGVENRAVGDKVVALNADGSHAEKRVVPAVMTWPVPEGLDPAAGRVHSGCVRHRAGMPLHGREPRGGADGRSSMQGRAAWGWRRSSWRSRLARQ